MTITTGTNAPVEETRSEVLETLTRTVQTEMGRDYLTALVLTLREEVWRRLRWAQVSADQLKDLCFHAGIAHGGLEEIASKLGEFDIQKLGTILAVLDPSGFVLGLRVPLSALPKYARNTMPNIAPPGYIAIGE